MKILGSSKSKNSNITENGITIYFYKLDIENLWRISNLSKIFNLAKDLIFKLNRKEKFFERSDKMSW